MNEKEILKNLMANSAFRKAFRDLMLEDVNLAEELGVGTNNETLVYVWCVELQNTIDGKKYYHPVVVPAEYSRELETMIQTNYYTMMCSENQFEAHGYDAKVDMMKCCVPYPIRMIVMPKSTFEKLETALVELVESILEEAKKCFEHFDNIAKMTHQDADRMKVQLLMSIFNNMSVVAACVNQDMKIIDSSDHEYVMDDGDDYDDEYEDCDEDEYLGTHYWEDDEPLF